MGLIPCLAAWHLRHEILPLLYARDGDPAARGLIEVVAEVKHDAGWMAYGARKQLATEYHGELLLPPLGITAPDWQPVITLTMLGSWLPPGCYLSAGMTTTGQCA